MKTDPDFLHTAAEWLDGTAGDGTCRLLDDLLHEPGATEEFAALARTESLLRSRSQSPAVRRAALETLLEGKPWPQRAMAACRRSMVPWGAAAAAAAIIALLLAWALWPESPATQPPRVVKHPATPRAMATDHALQPSADPDNLPADRSVEPWLRRYYVKAGPFTGPLKASAMTLAAQIKMEDGQPLTVDPQSDGDSSVHVNLGVSLPAWTLMEILAIQSGTEVAVSGKSVVFRPAKKPATNDGSVQNEFSTPAVLALFSMQDSEDSDQFLKSFASEAFGTSFDFKTEAGTVTLCRGTPRAVLALRKACSARSLPAQVIRWTTAIVTLPYGIFDAAVAEACPDIIRNPTGTILPDDGLPKLMNSLSGRPGVELLTLSDVVSAPNQLVKVTTNPEGIDRPQTDHYFTLNGLIRSDHAVTVMVNHKTEKWNEATKGFSTQELNTQMTIQTDQTIVLAGLIGEDRLESVKLVKVKVIDSTGTAPVFPDPPAPDKEDLPIGIPAADSPGFVFSPYAQDKGMVDVTGLPRGATVVCPYTGKQFRVP